MRVRLDPTDITFLLSTGTQETSETHLFERVETLHFCGSGILLTLQSLVILLVGVQFVMGSPPLVLVNIHGDRHSVKSPLLIAYSKSRTFVRSTHTGLRHMPADLDE